MMNQEQRAERLAVMGLLLLSLWHPSGWELTGVPLGHQCTLEPLSLPLARGHSGEWEGDSLSYDINIAGDFDVQVHPG
jgi:hypothetical protein